MLDTSETMFSVFAAINACGYDQEVSASDPMRAQIRQEMARMAESSERAKSALEDLCAFYRDHQAANASMNLAQYVSLGLKLGEPPAFTPTVKEADMPPDASYVLGMVPRLQRLYISADLHQIWRRHQSEYDALLERSHGPLSKMLLATDAYLRKVSGTSPERRFVVYLEPMAAPGQVNARNYGADYFMVVAPYRGVLRTDPIRHTYLHYVLDFMAAQRGQTMKRLEPLLESAKTAPMDESFKRDIALLVTESLIQAVEARTAVAGKNKEAEAERQRLAQKAAEEGFVLAPYFERQLAAYEKSEEGLLVAYPNWLHDIDVEREKKHANEIVFASSVVPENVQRTSKIAVLDDAEKSLAAGDLKGAAELAQRALDQKREDPARALFVLARVSTANQDMNGARTYFQRTLGMASDPRLVAWSHIYLGRICDLQAERDQALEHYRAALRAGDANPATRTAAERGLQHPYEPPNAAARRAAEQRDGDGSDTE